MRHSPIKTKDSMALTGINKKINVRFVLFPKALYVRDVF